MSFPERRCPVLLPPLNGMISLPTRTVGSVAMYTCDTDFEIVGGNENRTCGATSAWDGEELDCSGKYLGERERAPSENFVCAYVRFTYRISFASMIQYNIRKFFNPRTTYP